MKHQNYVRPAEVATELTPLVAVQGYIEATTTARLTAREFASLEVSLQPAVAAADLTLVVRDGNSGAELATRKVPEGTTNVQFPRLPLGQHKVLLVSGVSNSHFGYLSRTVVEIARASTAHRAELDPTLHRFAVDLKITDDGARRPVVPQLRRRDDPAWRFCQACTAIAAPIEGAVGSFRLPVGMLTRGAYTLTFDGFTTAGGALEFEIPSPTVPSVSGRFDAN